MSNKYSTGKYHGFSIHSEKGILREIRIPVQIRIPEIFKKHSHTFFKIQGIWDTGATNSVISSGLVNKMKIPPTGKIKVKGVLETKVVNTYIIDIILNNQVFIPNLTVSEGKLLGNNIDFLIGMDIIAIGDSTLMCHMDENKYICNTFSFRYPSFFEPIDFVKEIQRFNDEKKQKKRNKMLRKEYNKNKKRKRRK